MRSLKILKWTQLIHGSSYVEQLESRVKKLEEALLAVSSQQQLYVLGNLTSEIVRPRRGLG